MERSPWRKTTESQGIPRTLWKPKVLHRECLLEFCTMWSVRNWHVKEVLGDGARRHLWNVRHFLPFCQTTRLHGATSQKTISSHLSPWEPEISLHYCVRKKSPLEFIYSRMKQVSAVRWLQAELSVGALTAPGEGASLSWCKVLDTLSRQLVKNAQRFGSLLCFRPQVKMLQLN
jgi:hypothetical protein